MSSLRLKRGTEAQRLSVTPLDGELIYTTDTRHFYVGNGVTPGGVLVVGQSGYSGTSGYSGLSGFSGSNGPSGFSGAAGLSGYSGQPGITGLTGPAGISGHSGQSGVSGFSGAGLTLAKTSFDAVFDSVVVLYNVRIRVDSVNFRPQVQATATTFTANWGGMASISAQPNTINFTQSAVSVTNSVWVDINNLGLTSVGDSYQILLQDSTNSKIYRITCAAGASGASIIVENLI